MGCDGFAKSIDSLSKPQGENAAEPVVVASVAPSDAKTRAAKNPAVSLPVVPGEHHSNRIRKSKNGRRRAIVLALINILMVVHFFQWKITGKTLTPIEPSESMYTLNYGHLNAGFIFFSAAILATILLGRFVCGWGCHLVAYQDFCAWIMKKLGIEPKPFRSRFLVLAPLLLAIYMFIWPSAYRWFVGIPAPVWTNDLITTDFWKTFPGPIVAILSVLVCGFAVVYVLGAKAYCTYGCPYGGFFGLVEPVALGRIRVTDDCEHCGHCTAVCTSNVRVHEEVAKFGMVVDPGCMKCMDCVSVCPNDALYYGLGKPSIGAKPASPRKPVPYDFTLGEEIAMGVLGIVSLLIYRGLYGHISLLLAMGMAAISAYVMLKLWHLLTDANVRMQNLTLKHGHKLTRTGKMTFTIVSIWVLFTVHSGIVQAEGFRGRMAYQSLAIGDPYSDNNDFWSRASDQDKAQINKAIVHFERANRWGLMTTDFFLDDLVRLYLLSQQLEPAEKTAKDLARLHSGNPYAWQVLGAIERRLGRAPEAETAFRKSLEVNHAFAASRRELMSLLLTEGKTDEAVNVFLEHVFMPRDAEWALEMVDVFNKGFRFKEAKRMLEAFTSAVPKNARGVWLLGIAEAQLGNTEESEKRLRRSIELDPDIPEVQYDLAMVLLEKHSIAQSKGNPQMARSFCDEAIEHLQRAISLKPDFTNAHYNLGVATMMAGKPLEAIPYIHEAIRQNPNDEMQYEFLAHLLSLVGDSDGARQALKKAAEIRNKSQ